MNKSESKNVSYILKQETVTARVREVSFDGERLFWWEGCVNTLGFKARFKK